MSELNLSVSSRTNWRVIEADGHVERVTRDGAAYYLKIGRKQNRKWEKTKSGWKLN